MISRRQAQPRRHGSASIEFAVVLIFLLPMLTAIWEVGRLVEVEQHLNNAVREGGRQASTGNKNATGCKNDVINYLKANGITCTANDITITNKTSSSRNDPTQGVQLDQYHLDVTIKFDSVRWVLLNQITNVKNLTASTEFYSMRDVPLVINSTIPVE